MHLDHVIWDWNGTLMGDVDLSVRSVNSILATEGLEEIDAHRYRSLFRFPVREYYRELGLPTDPENFARISTSFYQNFLAGLSNCSLVPGTESVLQHLQTRGVRQLLLSAAEQRALEQMVDAVTTRDCFHTIRGTHDYSAGSKLDQGLELMREIRAQPEHTLLIGDTEHDAEVAQALGCDVVLVAYGHQWAHRLDWLGKPVAHSPAELLDLVAART